MRRLATPPGAPTILELNGRAIDAFEGEPVACALLAAGEYIFSRSTKYHRPRGVFCFQGSCSQCLMRVNGIPNVFTCRTAVQAGMRVQHQNAYPSAKIDALKALDWVFRHGMDPHRLLAGVPVAEQLMSKVARQLSGLGELPEFEKAAPSPPFRTLRTTLVVVGGGVSGTAAARKLLTLQVPFVLLERETRLGGRLNQRQEHPRLAVFPNDFEPEALWLQTSVVGAYEDAQGRFVAAIHQTNNTAQLLKVYAETFLFCPGGHPALLAFENNDLPGILDAGALGTLLYQHHLAPLEPVALIGAGRELAEAKALLTTRRVKIAVTVNIAIPSLDSDDISADVGSLKAHGRTRVSAVSFTTQDGRRQRVDCQTMALAVAPAPRFELAQQSGARVVFLADEGRFIVRSSTEGQTDATRVWVAGQIQGACSVEQSAAAGERAAEAAAGLG